MEIYVSFIGKSPDIRFWIDRGASNQKIVTIVIVPHAFITPHNTGVTSADITQIHKYTDIPMVYKHWQTPGIPNRVIYGS